MKIVNHEIHYVIKFSRAKIKGVNINNVIILKFRRALKRHGVIGISREIARHVAHYVARLSPVVRAEIKEREQRSLDFDKEFNVNTAGCIHQTELNIANTNALHAVSYGASDPKYFRDAIGFLNIDYKKFIFIDFGSGKGRAILLAAEFPFRRIIGLEFSNELNTIARDNIKYFCRKNVKCENIESVCIDVVEYVLPEDCVICYFCNPFDAEIMAKVISNLEKSIIQGKRDIIIVYYNPREEHLFDQSEFFERYGTKNVISMWRSKANHIR